MSTGNHGIHNTQGGSHSNTWGEYRVWAATARKLNASLQKRRRDLLWLTLSSAAVGAFAEQYPAIAEHLKNWRGFDMASNWVQPVLGFFAGLALAVAGIIAQRLATLQNRANHVRARSTAEALKSQTYLYVTGAPPYDAVDSDQRLFDQTDKLVQQVEKEILSETLTDDERKKRLPEYPMSIQEYIKQRVEDQVVWYRKRADDHGETVNRGRSLSIAFAVIGFVLSGLSGLSGISAQWEWLGIMPGWIPVVSAFSAAIAAHSYSERHEYLQLSYRATGRRLTRLLERWRSPHTDGDDRTERRTFIKNCEDIMSVENQAWMAEFLKEDETHSADID